MRIRGISKGFIKRILLELGILTVVAGLCCIDALFIEPYFPRVVRQEVRVEGLPKSLDGLKIVHLSDLHIVKLGKRESRAAKKIERIKPDLVCFTGDYIQDDGITPGSHTDEECVHEAIRFMASLPAKYGIYAVSGNWEVLDSTQFADAGIHMLDKTSVKLIINESPIILASTWSARSFPSSKKPRIPTVVLDHFPDAVEELAETNAPVDLVLAGHWHGGQVSWPIFGPFDKSTMKYPSGLYKVGDVQLYVTRGLGMHTYAVRFNCPSEITLIVLKRANPKRPVDK